MAATVGKRLGARIKELRRRQGLTQEALAERAKVSYKFLGEVERGTGNPSLKWLEQVSTALGIPILRLFDENVVQTIQFPALSGKAFSMVRDARNSLETVLREFADVSGSKPRRRKR